MGEGVECVCVCVSSYVDNTHMYKTYHILVR